jgi:hypothetical protein
MKWALFALLVLVAPAPVVAFDSFVTGPVVFVLAQLLYMLVDARSDADIWNPQIIMFFAVHLATYGFGYFIVAWGATQLLALIGCSGARFVALAVFALGVAALAALPIYGGGGIFGGNWGSLSAFFMVLERTHFGPDAALKIYGPALTILGLLALWRFHAGRPNFLADS